MLRGGRCTGLLLLAVAAACLAERASAVQACDYKVKVGRRVQGTWRSAPVCVQAGCVLYCGKKCVLLGLASGNRRNEHRGHSGAAAAARVPGSQAPALPLPLLQPGDTYYDLAAPFETDIATLEQLNPGVNKDDLKIGQVWPGRVHSHIFGLPRQGDSCQLMSGGGKLF